MKKYSWILLFSLSMAWGQTDPQAAALLEKVAQKIEGYLERKHESLFSR